MKNLKKWIWGYFYMACLSGCAGMNSNFDCPMQRGVMCKSLDQVNTMVDHKQIGEQGAPCQRCGGIGVASQTIFAPETQAKLRIWIAPYIDSENNAYASSVMYTRLSVGVQLFVAKA